MKPFPEFRKLVEQVHHRYPPVHLARMAFTVPEKDLFPEGLAVDWPRGVFYMGSMHRKKIIKTTVLGEVSDFVKPDLYGLMPVGGLKVDPADHSVWAATDPGEATGQSWSILTPMANCLSATPHRAPDRMTSTILFFAVKAKFI